MKPGDVVVNHELCEFFGCSPQGGMRRAHKTNSLVLIADHVKSVYHDRWVGDVFHYTGMGLKGDQDLYSNQNRTLAESVNSSITVHLFELFKPKQYTYTGIVKLAGSPYGEAQEDESGALRRVWVFPLALAAGLIEPLPEATLNELQSLRKRRAKKAPEDVVMERAKAVVGKPGRRPAITNQFDRNEWVARYVLHLAQGHCDLCALPAPFNDRAGEPFLEVHHVEWLARGGDDSITNAVALCPNCHRRIHVLEDPSDMEKLRARLISRGQEAA